MAKRARTTRSDRCERLRQRLADLNDKIDEILDELSDIDIPPGLRRRLEQMLKRLQSQRALVVRLLEKCEAMEARRARTAAKGRPAARKGAKKRRRSRR